MGHEKDVGFLKGNVMLTGQSPRTLKRNQGRDFFFKKNAVWFAKNTNQFDKIKKLPVYLLIIVQTKATCFINICPPKSSALSEWSVTGRGTDERALKPHSSR